MGSVAADAEAAKDLRWLKKAEHWGEWIKFADTELAEPQTVWMMRHSSGRVRFYEVGRGQVGPEHAHVVAGTYWAYGSGYLDADLSMIGLSLACRAEVLAGGISQ